MVRPAPLQGGIDTLQRDRSRPYVAPSSMESIARPAPSRASRTLAPPFWMPASYADPADWSRAGSADCGAHRRTPSRSAARRAEVGFEEWGRGTLVAVGQGQRVAALRSITVMDVEVARTATSEAGSESGPEYVAVVLETIALRVRVGEIRVPGASRDMSDVAILAATLAAMLAPRQ
jgi:hypothetical protein